MEMELTTSKVDAKSEEINVTESAYSRDTSWKKEVVKETASLLTKILNVFVGDESSSLKKQALALIQAKRKKSCQPQVWLQEYVKFQNTCWI